MHITRLQKMDFFVLHLHTQHLTSISFTDSNVFMGVHSKGENETKYWSNLVICQQSDPGSKFLQ